MLLVLFGNIEFIYVLDPLFTKLHLPTQKSSNSYVFQSLYVWDGLHTPGPYT